VAAANSRPGCANIPLNPQPVFFSEEYFQHTQKHWLACKINARCLDDQQALVGGVHDDICDTSKQHKTLIYNPRDVEQQFVKMRNKDQKVKRHHCSR